MDHEILYIMKTCTLMLFQAKSVSCVKKATRITTRWSFGEVSRNLPTPWPNVIRRSEFKSVSRMEIRHCDVSNLIRIKAVLILYRLRKIAGDISEFGPAIIRKFSKLAMHVDQRRIQHRRAGRAPPVWIFWGVVFVNLDCIIRIYLIVAIMQCLQYVLCSLLSLYKIGYVWKGIKTNPRSQEFYRAGTAPPGFEIPGTVTVD